MTNKIRIKPYTGALGAEILGIDLSKTLSKKHFNLIKNTLNEYHVIFFRKQDISPVQLVTFGKNFGKLEIHPLIPTLKDFPEIIELKSADDGPGPYSRNSRIWHSDMTYTKIPPMGAILKAITIPESGGNTMFLNACLAYEQLSKKMKNFLSKLQAVHSIVMTSTKEEILSEQGLSRFAKMQKALPPVEHPVIKIHPETGKKCIYVNEAFTSHITGLNHNESDSLLDFLYKHLHNPDFQCRFIWEKNSIAFWDNQVTQHFAVGDYNTKRIMHRLTIEGTKSN
jgi:taurine dioxygenase